MGEIDVGPVGFRVSDGLEIRAPADAKGSDAGAQDRDDDREEQGDDCDDF